MRVQRSTASAPSAHLQQFQARRLLLIRLFGSLAVFSLVIFFFMPVIRAQKESRRLPPSGCGGLRFMPCFFAEARPLAFRPPFSDLPSDLCHAGVLNFLAKFHLRCSYSSTKFNNRIVVKFCLANVIHVHNNLHVVTSIRFAAFHAVN